MDIPADTLRVIVLPLDQTMKLADVTDDENIAVTLIGQKAWLLDFVSSLAASSEEWKFV